jgi:uncharacterized protein
MKVDIYSHVAPAKYIEFIKKIAPQSPATRYVEQFVESDPTLRDLDSRFRIMDRFGDYSQVITMGTSHKFMYGEHAPEIAKAANDAMAELCFKYPERFIAGVAELPMNDQDACLNELDRAINTLKLRGVKIAADVERKPLDSDYYRPLYQKMCQYGLPLWLHPYRSFNVPDYTMEKESKFNIYSVFGWVYDTTAAMTRLVFGRILDEYPDLKILTHHAGAMVPFLSDRIISHSDRNEIRVKEPHNKGLKKHPIEYYRMFYCDTALNGCTSGLECAYDFFGPDRMLFGTDMPFDYQLGNLSIRKTIDAVERMDIPAEDKQKIFEGNARKFLRLDV